MKGIGFGTGMKRILLPSRADTVNHGPCRKLGRACRLGSRPRHQGDCVLPCLPRSLVPASPTGREVETFGICSGVKRIKLGKQISHPARDFYWQGQCVQESPILK